MDLGREMKSPGVPPATAVDEKEPKITYPGFSLSDKTADEFTKECAPKLGDEYAATVRLRVTSLTADEYGSRVGFDVMEMDDIAEEGEAKEEKGESEEADTEESSPDEEKTLGYKRKTSKKEAPDISAKSLVD